MTDAREMLEALLDDMLAAGDSAKHYETTSTCAALAAQLSAILAAMPEGPGLPWVSVDERLPFTEKDVWWSAPTYMTRRKGTWLTSAWQAKNAGITHWLPLSALPLPTDSGWVDAGVVVVEQQSAGVRTVATAGRNRPGLIEPGRYHVWLKPEEDAE
jgi:hypothetical protein